MDNNDLMVQLRSMDMSAIEGFINSLRSSPVLKLAIRTMSKTKGAGKLADVLLDETIPIVDIASLFSIASLPAESREHATLLWMETHPELAGRMKDAIANR